MMTVSLTVTQNESPPTIAEQPHFHQLAPQSLLHSAKSSCLSGALGSLNKPSLCYLGARIAFVQHRLISTLFKSKNKPILKSILPSIVTTLLEPLPPSLLKMNTRMPLKILPPSSREWYPLLPRRTMIFLILAYYQRSVHEVLVQALARSMVIRLTLLVCVFLHQTSSNQIVLVLPLLMLAVCLVLISHLRNYHICQGSPQ